MHAGESPTVARRPWARAAWIAVALLWPVALLNYLDRQMLASMKFSVMADVPDIGTDANWGLMLGQFKWVYAFLSPLGGLVADRLGRRPTIVASLVAWSAVTWATGSATTFGELMWARTLMGISEAFYIPAALALIADFHIGGSRSTAVGVHQTGIYIGQMLGGLAGFVADAPGYGWQWMFTTCGIVGVIYALPLMATLKNPPRSGEEAPKASPVAAASELFTNRNFLLLVAYFTLPAIAGWVIRDWGPKILRDQFGLSQGRAGMIAVFTVQIASLAGVLCGGLLADRLVRRSARGRIFASALGMVFFLPAMFGIGHAASVPMAIVALAIFGIGWGFFDCNNMPILSQIARPEVRATGYGIMNMVSMTFGGLGDKGYGILRDRGVAIDVIFGAFAAVALLSVVIVLLIRPRATETELAT
jgi:MFS family permease